MIFCKAIKSIYSPKINKLYMDSNNYPIYRLDFNLDEFKYFLNIRLVEFPTTEQDTDAVIEYANRYLVGNHISVDKFWFRVNDYLTSINPYDFIYQGAAYPRTVNLINVPTELFNLIPPSSFKK